MNYANILIQIRAQLNITQEELAKIVNVSFATVNRWENNRAKPSRKHMCILENLCKKNNIELEGVLSK